MGDEIQIPKDPQNVFIKQTLERVVELYKQREEFNRYSLDFRVVCLVLNLAFSLALTNYESEFWFWSLFGLITLISIIHWVSWFFPGKNRELERGEDELSKYNKKGPNPGSNAGFPHWKLLIKCVYLAYKGAQLSFLGVFYEYEKQIVIFSVIAFISAEILIHFGLERRTSLRNIRKTCEYYEKMNLDFDLNKKLRIQEVV